MKNFKNFKKKFFLESSGLLCDTIHVQITHPHRKEISKETKCESLIILLSCKPTISFIWKVELHMRRWRWTKLNSSSTPFLGQIYTWNAGDDLLQWFRKFNEYACATLISLYSALFFFSLNQPFGAIYRASKRQQQAQSTECIRWGKFLSFLHAFLPSFSFIIFFLISWIFIMKELW